MSELTKKDQAIVDVVSEEVIKRIQECMSPPEHSDFWLGEEEHYNAHKRIDKLLNMVDETTGIFRKTVITMICGLIMAALIVGTVVKIRGE